MSSGTGETKTTQHPRATISDSIICYATADWDADLWTNKQHMMNRLAAKGIPVLYVDSPGHRAPTASARDIRRVAHRLTLWRRSARTIRPGLWRDSPLLIPNYRYPPIVRVNEYILRQRLRHNERTLRLTQPIVWTYTPLGASLYDRNRHAGLIYHCVDDVAAFPGVDSKHYRQSEIALVREADVCIGSSKHLVRHLEDLGARDVRYWPNPADTVAFAAARRDLPTTSKRGRPVVGFIGAVQEHKIDMELIHFCAEMLPDVDFNIAGPHGFGLGRSAIDPSTFPNNVIFPGSITTNEVPELVASFDIGIIPYRINEYTAGVFPMKVFEYLASGLPVVSTRLPSLVGEVDYIGIADTREDFLRQLRTHVENPSTPHSIAERIGYASHFSWQNRIDEAMDLIAEVQTRRLPPGQNWCPPSTGELTNDERS